MIRLILGIALLVAMVLLAILYGAHVQTFDGTIVDGLAAIGSFIGAYVVATNYTTPNQP